MSYRRKNKRIPSPVKFAENKKIIHSHATDKVEYSCPETKLQTFKWEFNISLNCLWVIGTIIKISTMFLELHMTNEIF